MVYLDSNFFPQVKKLGFYPNSTSVRTYRKPTKALASSLKEGRGYFDSFKLLPVGEEFWSLQL